MSAFPQSPAGPRRAGRTRRVGLGALAVGLCAAMLGPARADAAPGGSRIDWTPCGDRLECATVPVPLDWAHPAGRTITLAVVRHLHNLHAAGAGVGLHAD